MYQLQLWFLNGQCLLLGNKMVRVWKRQKKKKGRGEKRRDIKRGARRDNIWHFARSPFVHESGHSWKKGLVAKYQCSVASIFFPLCFFLSVTFALKAFACLPRVLIGQWVVNQRWDRFLTGTCTVSIQCKLTNQSRFVWICFSRKFQISIPRWYSYSSETGAKGYHYKPNQWRGCPCSFAHWFGQCY